MAWDELEDEQHALTLQRLNCGRINFNSGSWVFMPQGLPVIAAILKHCRDNPDDELVIASHTDTVGKPDDNQTLSAARASCVMLLLAGDSGAMAERCQASTKSKNKDARQVLKWAAKVWNFGCDPGKVDNTPPPAAAVKAFKTASGKKFIKGYEANPEVETGTIELSFWQDVANLYGNTLRYDLLRLDLDGFVKLVDGIKWVDADNRSIGCGERYPIKFAGEQEKDCEENRRTEFLVLAASSKPAKAGTDGKYLERLYDGSYTFVDLECPPPEFFRTKLVEENLIFVIDCSGSMMSRKQKVDGKDQVVDRIGEARRNLARAILDLPPTTHFAVVAFNGLQNDSDEARKRVAAGTLRSGQADAPTLLWHEEGKEFVPLLKEATDDNKDAAADWVNSDACKAQLGTMTRRAMKTAFQATGLIEGKPTKLILLSDGAPTPNTPKTTDTVERSDIRTDTKTRAGGKKWKVDTIGMLTKVDETGDLVLFLKNLAADSGGLFTPVAAIPLVSAE